MFAYRVCTWFVAFSIQMLKLFVHFRKWCNYWLWKKGYVNINIDDNVLQIMLHEMLSQSLYLTRELVKINRHTEPNLKIVHANYITNPPHTFTLKCTWLAIKIQAMPSKLMVHFFTYINHMLLRSFTFNIDTRVLIERKHV